MARWEMSMLKHIPLMAFLGAAASSVIADQAGLTVPASLLAAAKQSPVEFAMALAYASVPSGLEIRESDDVMPSRLLEFHVDPKERLPVEDLITTFNAQHRDYRAVVMRGVIVVRPVKGTLPFLDEPSPLSREVTVTGLMAAATRVFAAVDPSLTGPILDSMGRKSDEIPVRLDSRGGRTVIDTLNQIVSQAPGRTWVVTTRREHDAVKVVSFGLIEANGNRLSQGLRRDDE